MKVWNILSFVEYWAVTENTVDRILLRIRRCPLASGLFLASVVSYGIAFFFALEQSIIMLSNLAKVEVMMLIGFPTLMAVLAIIVGSGCSLNSNDQV